MEREKNARNQSEKAFSDELTNKKPTTVGEIKSSQKNPIGSEGVEFAD